MINQELAQKYLKEQFDNTVWSYSRIASFYSCPYSFYDTYILGNRRGNFHAYVGSSVHQILEDFYSYHLSGGKKLRPKKIIDTLNAKFDLLMDNNPYANEVYPQVKNGVYRNVKKGLDSFIPNYFITAVERKILYSIGEYKFQAFLDFECGDYKHGDYKSRYDDKYSTQQNLYMYAKQVDSGTIPDSYDIVEYKNGFNAVNIRYNKGDVYLSLDWAVQGIEDIKKALMAGDFPKTPPINESKPKDKFFCEQLCRGCEHGNNNK